MASNQHDVVIKILYELCKACNYEDVYADHIGVPYKSVPILSSHGRGTPEVYSYNPDVWCKYKNTKKLDVIEVWDEQLEDASVADVILSALAPDIVTLSVICFNEKTADLARKLSKVILGSIYNEKGELLLDPSNVLEFILRIPDNIQGDQIKVKNYLRKNLNLEPVR